MFNGYAVIQHSAMFEFPKFGSDDFSGVAGGKVVEHSNATLFPGLGSADDFGIRNIRTLHEAIIQGKEQIDGLLGAE